MRTWQSILVILLTLPCLFLSSPGLTTGDTTARAAVLWGSRWTWLNENQTTFLLIPEETKNAGWRPDVGGGQLWGVPGELVGQEVVAGGGGRRCRRGLLR